MRRPEPEIPPAPDFSEQPYPSAGAKLAPAWQAVWTALHHHDELAGHELLDIMLAATDLTEAAALTLLTEACAAGWVYARRTNRYTTRRYVFYRLTYAARLVISSAPIALEAPVLP